MAVKIIDKVPEKNLVFVEQSTLDNKTFYEIYYCETKLFQNRGQFNEALKNWTSIIQGV